MFAGLELACAELVPVQLPPPQDGESMTRYALRVAAGLGLRPEDWLGGASFGSLVAGEIARCRPVRGVVLIGGALSAASFVRPLRWSATVARTLPLQHLHQLLARPDTLRFIFGPLPASQMRLLRDMLIATPRALLREGARLALSYMPATRVLCPVYAIHGERDRLMHPPPVVNCHIVPAAGHALAQTHQNEVREFLRGLVCN